VSAPLPFVPPWQSDYQNGLFQEVSERAARRSKEALPQLLAELDNQTFREELRECCPSVSNLPASELVERLVAEMSTVEVVSGFVANEDDPTTKRTMVWSGAGMSLSDALGNKFFLNYWHRRLDHASDFLTLERKYVRASADEEGRLQATFWPEDYEGCEGPTVSEMHMETGSCLANPESGAILGVNRTERGFLLQFWHSNWTHAHILTDEMSEAIAGMLNSNISSSTTSLEAIPCPHPDEPFLEMHVREADCTTVDIGISYALANRVAEFLDWAETENFHVKPFKQGGGAASHEEAAERSFYGLVNIHLVDSGSPLFGEVTAVFSSQFMRQTALIAPVDTGFSSSKCAWNSKDPAMTFPRNCSANKGFYGLGTMEHFNHVLLASHYFWRPLDTASPLARIFARLEGRWGERPISLYDLMSYFEVLPAGNSVFPGGVRFLIAQFRSLFGTKTGVKVQSLAKRHGWILVWALGMADNEDLWWGNMRLDGVCMSETLPANSRMIDPTVALTSTARAGLPLGKHVLTSFQQRWLEVQAARKRQPRRMVLLHNETSFVEWRKLQATLPDGLHVSPLRPGSGCVSSGADTEEAAECVGVTKLGQCVCYESTTGANMLYDVSS